MPDLFPEVTTYRLPGREFKHANAPPSQIILVLLERDNQQESLAFIEKIMRSVDKSLQDTTTLFMSPDDEVIFSQSIYRAKARLLLSFGLPPEQLGLNFNYQLYKPFTTNQCTYLFASSLVQLQESKEEKKKLWSALKVMFP